MTTIGPNFGNELALAGVGDLAMSWTSDGNILYGPSVTSEQQAAVATVLAAHNPETPDPRATYAQKIALGCQIVSTGTPELNGTYPVDGTALGKYDGIVACINAGKGLPGGGGTFNLLDISGNAHAIGARDFENLVAAGRDYVYELIATETALLGGHDATWPVQPVTIA